jgi:ABC-type nickel/cobalt efflux system permease component RcnA
MNPTVAVVLLVVAFAIVGVFGFWFMARETRRFHEEHNELERRHREVMDSADRVLRETRRAQKSVTDPQRDRQTIN